MEQYNPGQVKRYIKQLKQREEQYVRYLGELAYQAGEQGKLEEGPLLDAYRALRDIRDQEVRWEEYLRRIQAARKAPAGILCPRCGNPLTPGVAQCAYCGQPVSVAYPGAARVPQAGPQAGPPPYGVPYGATTTPGPAPAASGFPGAAPVPPGAPPVAGSPVSAPAAPPPAAETPGRMEVPYAPPAAGIGAQPGGPGPSRCARCGSELEPDALFCGHCGTRVGPQAGQEVGAGVAPSGKGAGVAAQVAAEGAPHGAAGEEARETGGGEAAVQAPEAPPNCPVCGKTVEEPEARFCPDCGARLRE